MELTLKYGGVRVNIRWYNEDGVSYGWKPEQNMREDDHQYEVREVEPGVFAGFERNLGGDFSCTTHDHRSHSSAQRELSEGHPA